MPPPTASLALLGAGVGLLIIGAGLGGGAVRAGNELSQPAFNFSIFDPSQQAIEARGLNMQAAGIAFDVLGLLAISAGAASVGTWSVMDLPLRVSLGANNVWLVDGFDSPLRWGAITGK